MSDDFDIIRGNGNVFRALGHLGADREQLRALLAAQIIGVLDDRKLTVRAAQELTGVAASDSSRIRQVKLGRFTIDRPTTILAGLGQDVELTVRVRPRVSASTEVGLQANCVPDVQVMPLQSFANAWLTSFGECIKYLTNARRRIPASREAVPPIEA